MELVYITEKNGSAIKSQVFELLNELAMNKHIKVIHLLLATKNIYEKIDFKFHKKIKIIIFRNYGMYPIIDFLNIKELQKVLKNILLDKNTLFHVRSEYMSYLFYKAYKSINKKSEPKLYIDIRGAVKEELEMSNLSYIKKYIKINYLNKINYFLFNKSFKCNVVSLMLQEYLLNKYKIKDISIIPCIAGKNFIYNENIRKEIREELRINDSDILLVFSSGATNSWQNTDDVVDLFSKKYKLLMLTKKEYSDKNVISKFVDFNDVPKYLNAADIGIILRSDSIVNNVSSPIKFSEYMSCGLPVITDGNVHQINEFLNINNFGSITNNLDNIEDTINSLLNIDRTLISKKGIESYGIKNIALQYFNEYLKLKGQ